MERTHVTHVYYSTNKTGMLNSDIYLYELSMKYRMSNGNDEVM